jgi:hypothetical protein
LLLAGAFVKVQQNRRALFMKSIAVKSVSLSRASVYGCRRTGDEPATMQSQASQGLRDRSAGNDDAVGAQLERNSRGRPLAAVTVG